MYAAAARAQFFPDPDTPGAVGFGNFATLQVRVRDKDRSDEREEQNPL